MSGQERGQGFHPPKRVAPDGGGRPIRAADDSVTAEEARIAELLSNQQKLEERNRVLEEQVQKSQQLLETSQTQASMMLEQNRGFTVALQESSAAAKAAIEATAAIRLQQQQNCTELQQLALQQAGPAIGVPPQPGVAAVPAQVPEHAKVKKFIDGVVQKNVTIVTKAQQEINSASAAKAGLEELVFDLENPKAPLPNGVPNKAKSLHSPKLKVTDEMASDETCTAALDLLQVEVDKKLRALQREFVVQGIIVRTQIMQFYTTVKSEAISDGKVRASVRDMMTDTAIPAALQTQMIEAASESFKIKREAAIAAVEMTRKNTATELAKKHENDEEARLKLLTENNSKTVGAIIDAKFAELKLAEEGEDEEMEISADQKQAKLAAANADYQSQLGATPNFGRAPRAQKTQKSKDKAKGKHQPKKPQPTKPPQPQKGKAQKGKASARGTAGRGKGKGRGKGRGGGGRAAH